MSDCGARCAAEASAADEVVVSDCGARCAAEASAADEAAVSDCGAPSAADHDSVAASAPPSAERRDCHRHRRRGGDAAHRVRPMMTVRRAASSAARPWRCTRSRLGLISQIGAQTHMCNWCNLRRWTLQVSGVRGAWRVTSDTAD